MVFPYFTFSIGITTASAALLGVAMNRTIQGLKNDWKNQRCKPHGMLAAGIPGVRPKGVSASQNYKECQLGMFQGFFNSFMAPITAIISVITDIITEMANSINNMRNMIAHIRNGLENALGSITSKIYNLSTRIAWLFKKVITIVGGIFNVFVDLFGIIQYAFYTLSTIWNGTIGAAMRFFCFDPDTEIDLNVSTTKIKNLKIGDKLKDNNEVIGIIKINSNGIDMYNYNNIIVSGSHLVNENNKWIRVEDSKISYRINYKKKYIYCLSTTTARISINNQLYADYIETTDSYILEYMFNIILNHLNNIQPLTINNIRTTEPIYQWGVLGNTMVNTLKGVIKIKDCKIGDLLKKNKNDGRNNIITGVVKFKIPDYDSQPLYNYNGVICTGSMIIYENKQWIPIFNSLTAVRVINRPKYMYNIITTNNTFYSNNILWRDFEQTNDNNINELIDSAIMTGI
jgi:hypothetical protein